MQTGASGLRARQRPSQDTLRDREHTDPTRQQVREALNLFVACDTQRGDMAPALEAVEDAFNAVCGAIAQPRILQRPPRVPRVGDQGLPVKTLAARRAGSLV